MQCHTELFIPQSWFSGKWVSISGSFHCNFPLHHDSGILRGPPPQCHPFPQEIRPLPEGLKGSWCPKKSPKKGRLFLGGKGWHSGGWWEAVGPLDFEETLQGKIIHHLCSGACILGGRLIQPNMNQGAIFKGWNSLDRAMMAPKAMRKNSSMEGSSWWKTETRKKTARKMKLYMVCMSYTTSKKTWDLVVEFFEQRHLRRNWS